VNNDVLDKAIATFARAYGDQSERDHAGLKKAARSGRLEVIMQERQYMAFQERESTDSFKVGNGPN